MLYSKDHGKPFEGYNHSSDIICYGENILEPYTLSLSVNNAAHSLVVLSYLLSHFIEAFS